MLTGMAYRKQRGHPMCLRSSDAIAVIMRSLPKRRTAKGAAAARCETGSAALFIRR